MEIVVLKITISNISMAGSVLISFRKAQDTNGCKQSKTKQKTEKFSSSNKDS